MRGEWIEIVLCMRRKNKLSSLPMRGEWIEIGIQRWEGLSMYVSPHAGRVD